MLATTRALNNDEDKIILPIQLERKELASNLGSLINLKIFSKEAMSISVSLVLRYAH